MKLVFLFATIITYVTSVEVFDASKEQKLGEVAIRSLQNIYEFGVKGVGGWGGTCTCPDGLTYQVGDHGDNCATLACVGGIGGMCSPSYGPWSYRRVICATTHNVYETHVPGIGAFGGECTCPDGNVYDVGDEGNSCQSLACINGRPGKCKKYDGVWSYRKVTCGHVRTPVWDKPQETNSFAPEPPNSPMGQDPNVAEPGTGASEGSGAEGGVAEGSGAEISSCADLQHEYTCETYKEFPDVLCGWNLEMSTCEDYEECEDVGSEEQCTGKEFPDGMKCKWDGGAGECAEIVPAFSLMKIQGLPERYRPMLMFPLGFFIGIGVYTLKKMRRELNDDDLEQKLVHVIKAES